MRFVFIRIHHARGKNKNGPTTAEYMLVPRRAVWVPGPVGWPVRKVRKLTNIPVRKHVTKITADWCGIFRMATTRCRYAKAVPKSPKPTIRGPITEPIRSAAKPIVKEVMIASVLSQETAKNTRRINSKSGLTLRCVTAITSNKLPACNMVMNRTSTANRNQRI